MCVYVCVCMCVARIYCEVRAMKKNIDFRQIIKRSLCK